MTDRSSAGGAAAAAGVDYQALVGAFMAVRMLGESAVPTLWNLPANTVLTCLRAESGAAVDDVLVSTSNDGNIFIQAKRKLGMSDRVDSVLGEAFQQFVKLFLNAANTRASAADQKRALDPDRDRIVLATGSASTSVEDHLVSTLRRLREMGSVARPSGCVVNRDERSALAKVIWLTRRCWRQETGSTPDWNQIAAFLRLVWISVFKLELDETDEQLAKYWLRDKILQEPAQADTAWKTLKDKAIGLAKRRSGLDLAELQRTLKADGLRLQSLRSYDADIHRLQQQTRSNLRELLSFSRIEYDGIEITIRRDYEAVLMREAEAASLVVIGEAGCGKSGLLGVFAERLQKDGRHSLVLNAAELGAASLGQLRAELALENELIDVLEQWTGPGAAFLVIDALDSARDDRTAATLRRLIERVQQLRDRWRVVATIRKFDLKNGKHWQQLMPGSGVRPHFDPAFDDVRHLNIGLLTDTEIETLKDTAPALYAMVAAAPPALVELLRVPFNLMLANELRRADAANDLNTVTSQLSLLDRYWDRRVNGSISERVANEAFLRVLTESMISARCLYVPTASVIAGAATEPLLSRSVLVEGGGRLQYRHHVLFDYAVERVLLRPDSDATLVRLETDRDLPITVGPSLKYWLEGAWERDPSRRTFWSLSLRLASSAAPALAKLVVGTVAADKTVDPADCAGLLATTDSDASQRVFMFVADAISANAARVATKRPNPWFAILEQLAPTASMFVVHRAAFLLHTLLNATIDPLPTEMVSAGRFARAALLRAWSSPTRNQSFVRVSLRAVNRTFRSATQESEVLLRTAFVPSHLEAYGYEELPLLAHSALEFVVAPSFLIDLYATTFAATASADEKTIILNSQIVGLTSNKKQDLDGARWQLGSIFDTIATANIELATSIAVHVANQYVAREARRVSDTTVEFEIFGSSALFRVEGYIAGQSANDQELKIVETLAQHLSRLATDPVRGSELPGLIRTVATENRTTLVWNELASTADDSAAMFLDLREMLFFPALLSLFSKPFIAALRAHGSVLNSADRAKVEAAILAVRDSGYGDVTAFRLLQALGAELLSMEARTWFDEEEKKRVLNAASNEVHENNGRHPDDDDDDDNNDDDDASAYVLRRRGMTPEDLKSKANRDARRRTKELAMQLGTLSNPFDPETAKGIEDRIRALEHSLATQAVHPAQTARAWGVLAEVAAKLAESGIDSVADILLTASRRPEPAYDEEEERQFAQNPSWGSGQARTEAAAGLMAIGARTEAQSVLIAIQELSVDRVSSVRFQVARELPRLGEKHRDLYWTLLDRLSQDNNAGVVGWLQLGHALWLDPVRGLAIVMRAYEKWLPLASEHGSLVESLFNLLLRHALSTGDSAAARIVEDAATDAVANSELMSHAVMSLRNRMTEPRELHASDAGADELRQRSIAYVARVTSAALATFQTLAAKISLTAPERDRVHQAGKLLIDIAQEIYFASLAYDDEHEERNGKPDPKVRVRFFEETKEILKDLTKAGFAGSAHSLIQTLASLIDLVNPIEIFLLVADVVRAGRSGGYQYEELAVKEVVAIVERYLADFRVIFMDNVESRAGLRDILDTFVEAGWPETHRLVYSLDSIFR